MKTTYTTKNIFGVSLVEILIALAISTALFTIIASALRTGGSGLATITSSNELLEDTRNAGEIILDSLQNSVYVYPPLVELELNASTSYFNTNPNTGDNIWITGQDPIIAMIVAPRVNQLDCPTNPAACLTFVAYYAVKRSLVTSANGLDYAGFSLPVDSQNPDALMLFEYRKSLNVDSLSFTTPPPTTSDDSSYAGQLDGVTARLVADYVDPINGFVITSDGDNACSVSGILSACLTTPPNVNYEDSLISGSFGLNTLFNKGRKAYKTPELVFNFSPRNLY